MFYNTVKVVGNYYFDWLENYVKEAKAKNPYDHIHTIGSVEMCATGQCVTPVVFDEDGVWSDPIRWPFRRMVLDGPRFQVLWEGNTSKEWVLIATIDYDYFLDWNTEGTMHMIWNWIEYAEESFKSLRK